MAARIALIVHCYQRLLGKPLITADISFTHTDLVHALWVAPQAILAHDTQADRMFFFGNAAALRAFETTAADFTQMPSRLSAEIDLRDERQTLLDRVSRDGFIDDYSGIRISARGRRFAIAGAVVWNLIDADGSLHGQAASFTPPE